MFPISQIILNDMNFFGFGAKFISSWIRIRIRNTAWNKLLWREWSRGRDQDAYSITRLIPIVSQLLTHVLLLYLQLQALQPVCSWYLAAEQLDGGGGSPVHACIPPRELTSPKCRVLPSPSPPPLSWQQGFPFPVQRITFYLQLGRGFYFLFVTRDRRWCCTCILARGTEHCAQYRTVYNIYSWFMIPSTGNWFHCYRYSVLRVRIKYSESSGPDPDRSRREKFSFF